MSNVRVSNFANAQQVLDYLEPLGLSITELDIPEQFCRFATQEIIERTDDEWETTSEDQIVDGTSESYVRLETAPIVSVSGVAIRDANNENEVELTSDEYIIEYRPAIIYLTGDTDILTGEEPTITMRLAGNIFPSGVRNVTISGVFGTTPRILLEELAILLIIRRLRLIQPDKYGFGDIISETLGNYSYKLGGSVANPNSKKMSLDDTIDYLFSIIPQRKMWVTGI